MIIRKQQYGPRPLAKVFLGIAVVIHFLLLEPILTWGVLLPSKCLPLKVFSGFDLLILSFAVSLVLYFAFLVKEYQRQREECMFQFIKQSETGIAYRSF